MEMEEVIEGLGEIEKLVLQDHWKKLKPHLYDFNPVIELAQARNSRNWQIWNRRTPAQRGMKHREKALEEGYYWQPGNTQGCLSDDPRYRSKSRAKRAPESPSAYYAHQLVHWVADWAAQLAKTLRPELMWGGLSGDNYSVAAGFLPDQEGEFKYFIQTGAAPEMVGGYFAPVRLIAIVDFHGGFLHPDATAKEILMEVDWNEIFDSYVGRKALISTRHNGHIKSGRVYAKGEEPEIMTKGFPWFWDKHPEFVRPIDNPRFAKAFAEHSAKLPCDGTLDLFADRTTRYSSLIEQLLD